VNEQSRRALTTDRVIDITTTGRTSGQPRRKEMWFHNIDGGIYITGTPGTRDWYANMVANPAFTFHLKESVSADLPARARPIIEPDERRAVLTKILAKIGRSPDQLDAWLADSPLVAVTFDQRESRGSEK
jgi:deazaflavin-dependent oxidoreductase (nitroreductase family)